MSKRRSRLRLILPILGCLGGGSLYGWSGLAPAVQMQFGTTNAATAMVFSIALVSFTLGVLAGPITLARLPAALHLPVLVSIASASLFVSAAITTFPLFVLAYGVGFGAASGALYNYAVACAAASPKPTLLVPVTVASFGLGGVVFGPISVWLTGLGWGTLSVVPPLFCLASVGLASFAVGVDCHDVTAQPNQFVRPDKTTAMLWAIFAAGSCAGLIVLGLAAQFLPAGASGLAIAGTAVFFVAAGNTMGRLSAAGVAGWFDARRGVGSALALSVMVLAALTMATAPSVVLGLLFLLAFSYGHLAAQIPLLVRDHTSPSLFPGTFGWVFTGWGVAGLVGPWTAGWALDVTGSMRAALFGCVVLSCFALWLVTRLPKGSIAQS